MHRRPHSPRILLVEDNPADANLVSEVFEESRFAADIEHVEDGIEAMDFLNRRPPFENAARPDLVLLDLNLPRKNGRQVLKEIKADETLKLIPVIVLTTSSSENDILESYRNSANCYLTKPIDFDEFVRVVGLIKDFWFSAARLPHLA